MKNSFFIIWISLLLFSCKKDSKISPIAAKDLGPKILKVITTFDTVGYNPIGERVAIYSGDTLKSISIYSNSIIYQFQYINNTIAMNTFRYTPDYEPFPIYYYDFIINKKEGLIDKIDLNSVAYSYFIPFQWRYYYLDGKLDSTTLFSEEQEYLDQNIKNASFEANNLVEFDSYNSYAVPNKVKISYGVTEISSKVNTLPYNNFLLSQFTYLFFDEGGMIFNRSIGDYYLFQRELSVTGVKSDKLITAIFIENRDGTESDISYTIDYERDAEGHISKMTVFKNGERYRVEEFEYE